ncbi:MAG: excinuclease ABC subunit UvrA [Ectothiorhodospiraceae bacterium]|nr:excinuclease ABC subunit UvrA [Ectothiorhodospiraceae bacterium]
MSDERIRVRGARQNNLKGIDLDLPLGELIVVTGVSGSGKSSLAFDTVYAEGQRRYVETFSPYARQFLDRMDRPRVDGVDGIPPAIAIDQTNPVRTSRSTVGTMTELNDHLKLLFARAATLHCRGCGRAVRRDTARGACDTLLAEAPVGARVAVTFALDLPDSFGEDEVRAYLARQGYTRVLRREGRRLEVVQDRLRIAPERRDRLAEALEAAFARGRGAVAVYPLDDGGSAVAERAPDAADVTLPADAAWRFSSGLHCPHCDLDYRDPTPSLFSFNSPVGACTTCRGFGRTMGIDDGLVVPDESKTLAGGAVKPWQTESNRECQRDLLRFARKRGVPVDVPWRELSAEHRRWVMEGEGSWDDGVWYGVRRFFEWLESKSYRMHIRVLLSRYRAYRRCPACHGARLDTEALLWRLGTAEDADAALGAEPRFRPRGVGLDAATLAALPGLHLHELVLLPLDRCRAFFERLTLPAPLDEATELLLGEIRSRLRYLTDVGLAYLTLDRQSRTLSGGEVQRINLTTALGTSLVNTLFVLDEPSIGLHARDMSRVVGVLHRLRDAGNSLLVVEHDPQVMLAADRVLDMGPGPGEAGGTVVFEGTPRALMRARGSRTGAYLAGRASVLDGAPPPRPVDEAAWLAVHGASEHNLADLDVRLPLNRLVCVTGVSGSGKSTLVEDVIYRAVAKSKGRGVEAPGAHRALDGADLVDDVVMVDQSAIGKTTRSNPASFVGALDPLRKLFAVAPLARERGYTPGTFSFNSGNGRCPTCGGNGFEHVEMQFLSDVYLRCPDCDGRRFRAEVLEVVVEGADARPRSMAEVLDLTVDDALVAFADQLEVTRALEPLAAVGLGYLRLGQPVPTLSGGESQRLKLAGHLAKSVARGRGGLLLLLDEPTTGLHFEDVAVLLTALRRLVADGHSVVVIEHNLDLVRAADWVIDLGPEGGDGGGRLVVAGTPDEVAACSASHTGAALRDTTRAQPARRRRGGAGAGKAIRIHNAREHNLKGVDVAIPRQGFTVITGVSGSGKSTLAFDILFAEGQRRYLESLNAYARQFVQPAARPDVDAVFGIPPTVSIEQRTSRGGRKSTVGTLTEVHHFLRLLWVKLGTQHCPQCDVAVDAQSPDAIVARLLREHRGKSATLLAPLVVARKGYYTDLARWAAGRGHETLWVDGIATPTEPWPRLDRFREHDIDLPLGAVSLLPREEGRLREVLDAALGHGKGMVRIAFGADAPSLLLSTRRACPSCGRSFPELDPRLFSYNSKHGWCERCYGTGVELAQFDAEQTGEERAWNEWYEGAERTCRGCHGQRLRPEALAVRFHDRSIAAVSALPVAEARAWVKGLALGGREAAIARDLAVELGSRLAFLDEVGLGYLGLDRSAPTLSGGEAQRIRLAAQLGSSLRGVCYILDEPTIGLHTRDNLKLLDTLERLSAKGNTVVVVEHDEDTIRRASHVIDLGPGAGRHGGEVVAAGTPAALARNRRSVTGRFLREPSRHPLVPRRPVDDGRGEGGATLCIAGATRNNLVAVDVAIPLGRLVCVTGVSGSGKSTLVRQVLLENLTAQLAARGRRGRRPALEGCLGLEGLEPLARVLEVDQTPIGKTPRSCPATYVGIWDHVRRLLAGTEEARMRGFGPARFSFNVRGGRCEACEGQGEKKVEMSFLPDVRVPCEVCGGARFTPETLAVRYAGRSVAELLETSVDDALSLFAAHRQVHHALGLLHDVGLGYLTLGQRSPTLSGGEAQRIKLVAELARVLPTDQAPVPRGRQRRPTQTLYVLDEPTIGLHMADVENLVRVLHRLVEGGNTVVVIEHNLDLVAEADWVVDLGPEGGTAGGRVVATGTPEAVARTRTHTGRALASFLRGRRGESRARRRETSGRRAARDVTE